MNIINAGRRFRYSGKFKKGEKDKVVYDKLARRLVRKISFTEGKNRKSRDRLGLKLTDKVAAEADNSHERQRMLTMLDLEIKAGTE